MELAIVFVIGILIWLYTRKNKPEDQRLTILEEFERFFPTYAANPRDSVAKQRLLTLLDKYTDNYLAINGIRGSYVAAALLNPNIEPAVTTNQLKSRMHEVHVSFLYFEYANSLQALKSNPTSPDAHQRTLSLGREYASVAREGGRVTIFDETALANDIRATTANASQSQKVFESPLPNLSTPATSLKERISALTLMKESGLLSDEEYDRKRREILDQI